MGMKDGLRDIVRAARARLESDRLAGVDVTALSIPGYVRSGPTSQGRSRGRRARADTPPRPSRDPELMPEPLSERAKKKLAELTAIEDEIGDCARCGLGSGRTCLVFGAGNPDAEVMFVGEGPGYEEDKCGEPFVGRAGRMLTRIIENVLLLQRRDVYIANVVKCRPPNNRAPLPDETAACGGFLLRQIEVVRPRIIVALGAPATRALLEKDVRISKARGRFVEKFGAQIMPTFHPAYLLRRPEEKRKVYEDMLQARALLEKLAGEPRGL